MKVNNLLFFILIFLFINISLLSGQSTFERTYGGIFYDSGNSIIETADQGFVIMATSNSYNNNINAAYVIRTDADGDTLWTKVIRGESPNSGIDIQPASDGGYVLAVASSSVDPSKSYEIYLVKIDDSGNTLWSKSYGGTSLDYVHSMAKTFDGGYVILAHTLSFGNGGSDFYLIRVDQSGDTLWTKTYGGSEWDWGCTVQQTYDKGFILVGDTESFGDLNGDVFLIKTDSSGHVQWQNTFGGPEHDRGYYVIQTNDTGYMIAGRTESYGAGSADCYVIRTDARGDSLWTMTLGGIDSDAAQVVQQTSDGNFVLSGGVSSMGLGKSDVYLVKFTPDGNLLWERFYGGPEHDWGQHVIELRNGGFAFIGGSESFIEGNDDDIYLVKTDGSGNVTNVSGRIFNGQPESISLYQNYPNPFNPTTVIRFSLPSTQFVTLKVYNLLGHEIDTIIAKKLNAGHYRYTWNVRSLASGLYIYRLTANDFVQNRKMLLLH